jgi:hypothetical protein
MSRTHLLKFLVLALLVVTETQCTKHADGTTGAIGPAGQAGANGVGIKPSPITGYIELYDEFYNPLPYSPGANLSVLKGDSLFTAITDSSGKFSLPALPPGNYSIHVTKAGFDSLEIFVQHSGGDEAKFIGSTSLVHSITAKITGQTATIQGLGLVLLTTTFSGPPLTIGAQRNFWYYFSHSRNLTTQNNDAGFGQSSVTGTNQYQNQFYLSNLSQSSHPFHSGDSVYVEVVLDHTFQAEYYYYDYANNRSVRYPYLGDSAITSFVMP